MRFGKIFLPAGFFLLAVFVGVVVSATPALAQASVTLLVHDVTARPIPGTASYEVIILFTLLDSGGNPIKEITADHFTVREDGRPVAVGAPEAVDSPINVALVLDTSGSMVGEKIEAARAAASGFIDALESRDRVAVLTFDRSVVHRIDFTTDHAAARQQVELIEATRGGFTCLYDAAYETVRMAAALPAGRRAIILLTDGRDEGADRQPCSAHSVQEVIALASRPEARVPIYTIGLGKDADTQILEQIARQTGGRHQASPGPTQLEAFFGRLADEVRSQYVVRYVSTAQAGEHTLMIRVDYHGVGDEVSRSVILPALPYVLTFTSPTEGATVSRPTTLVVVVTGQGAPIRRVFFLANGVAIGSDDRPPYELEWDPAGQAEGTVFLEAVAQDANGAELARGGVTVTYAPGTVFLVPAGVFPLIPVIAASVLGFVLVLVLVLVAGRRRRRRAKVEGIGVAPAPVVAADDRTLDAFAPSENALGVLVVLQSDDPAMVGQRIEITQAATTLGRRADNEIVFPQDGPVSRHHAVIEERGGRLFLSEVLAMDESGRARRPTYGTFVDGEPVQEPVVLRDGCEIRLGKRLRLRFEAVRPVAGGEERTHDRLTSGDDRTMDRLR